MKNQPSSQPEKQKLRTRALEMRHNPTPEEAKLWACLRANQIPGAHFRRQHPIGNYIVDFCSLHRRFIIELDGSQHLEQEEYDNQRTEFLESKGFRVLRFSNQDVLANISGVIAEIEHELEPMIAS
jgi:very-short-patch-repair endonuclease